MLRREDTLRLAPETQVGGPLTASCTRRAVAARGISLPRCLFHFVALCLPTTLACAGGTLAQAWFRAYREAERGAEGMGAVVDAVQQQVAAEFGVSEAVGVEALRCAEALLPGDPEVRVGEGCRPSSH